MTICVSRGVAALAAAAVAVFSTSAASASNQYSGDVTVIRPGLAQHTLSQALLTSISSAWAHSDPCGSIDSGMNATTLPWLGANPETMHYEKTSCYIDSSGAGLYLDSVTDVSVTLEYDTVANYLDTEATLPSDLQYTEPDFPHFRSWFGTQLVITLGIKPDGSVGITAVRPNVVQADCHLQSSTFGDPTITQYANMICQRNWNADIGAALAPNLVPLVNNLPAVAALDAFTSSSKQAGYPATRFALDPNLGVEVIAFAPFHAGVAHHLPIAPPTTIPHVMPHVAPIPSGAIATPTPTPSPHP